MKQTLAIFSVLVIGVGAYLMWPGDRDSATPARCDDGDPCTIDRYHDAQGKCIHVPDALCTRDCNVDSDCAYPPEIAPCLSATCVSGACRYMEIGREECIRCDEQTPCPGSYCDARQCIGGFCRHAPRDCDDQDSNTWDRCDEKNQRCVHWLGDKLKACMTDVDCADGHPCRTMTCEGGLCKATPATARCQPLLEPRQCKRNTDCIATGEDGVCIAGPCEKGWCRWREVPRSKDCKPCTGDHDCDGSFCEWPICTGTVCTTESVPFCQDTEPDTRDICSEALKGCLHQYDRTPKHCSKAPKDDGDSSTVDFCSTADGTTHHLPAGKARCESANRCWNVYEGPDGFCIGHELDCKHDDACAAHCDPAVGCVLDPDKDCHCRNDDECDLGNPCSKVFCIDPGPDGACWGTFIDDCIPCRADDDCVMDNWCVFGRCREGYCRYTDGVTCDDGDPDTFGFCHGQRDDPCTYERIYDYK